MAEDIVDEIVRLRNEAAQAKYDYPSMASVVVNHPGVLSYQVKTAPHYQQDMRRAQFLSGVAGVRDRYKRYMRVTGDQSAHVLAEGLGRAGEIWPGLEEAVDKRDELRGPYWKRGVLAYGQPLRAGTDFMQAYASTNLNAGRMIAGDEGAGDDLADSANRLLLGLPRAIAGHKDPMQDAWEAERRAEEQRPIDDMSFAMDASPGTRVTPRLASLPYESQSMSGMTVGADLAEPLMGDGLPGKLLGVAVDIATDPATGAVDAIRALSKGMYAKGAYGLAGEAFLPTAFLGTSEFVRRDAEEKARKMREERGIR